uniref:IQ motif containing G n=1 Tax=Athene cunicularia TaxID=194338 RepID=A0A663MZY7_ATHCN
MEKFTHLEALLFAAVLENCVDQLSILGYIMPVSYEGKTDISHVCASILPLERNLSCIEHKQQLGKTEDLKTPMKYSCILFLPGRQYARDVITVTMKKVQESGKFNSLTEANEREKAKKSKFHDFLIRSEGKKEIKSLEKQLQDVKKETEIELQNRDNMIAYLRDELQEMRTKMNMESRYMKKSTDLQIHQTQKKCSNAENVLDKEIQKLRTRTDEEIRVHTEIENFLRQHHKVEEKLEYWADKYENDMDAKTEELDALKAAKANNLEMLQRLAEEETIISDRAEKEAKRRLLEQDALELKSILKLQAWWKGTMVRRNLGPYQALKKIREKQLSKQKEKGNKDKSGAKKKMR